MRRAIEGASYNSYLRDLSKYYILFKALYMLFIEIILTIARAY